MNYQDANELLQGRNHDSRKLGNNTYLERKDKDIAVRLHNTAVLTFHPDNSVTMNTGGWRTVTTKARINEYAQRHNGFSLSVQSERGEWKLYVDDSVYKYEDGATIHTDGSVSGADIWTDNKAVLKLKRQVSKYVEGFIAAMEGDKIDPPGLGDCFYCQMRVVKPSKDVGRTLGEVSGSDHLKSHLQEKYYVPSLLERALDVMPHSKMMLWWVWSYWDKTADISTRMSARQAGGDFAKRQVAKALKRYILKQLGLQA